MTQQMLLGAGLSSIYVDIWERYLFFAGFGLCKEMTHRIPRNGYSSG